MLYSLFLSFTDYSAGAAPRLIGFENYIYMFTRDPRLTDSLRSTFAFVLEVPAAQSVLGLGIAL